MAQHPNVRIGTAVDLRRLGYKLGTLIEDRDNRHDVTLADDRAHVAKLADDSWGGRVKAHFLGRLAQRCLDWRFTRIQSTTGEADLTAMIAQLHRPAGKQNFSPMITLEQRDENRRYACLWKGWLDGRRRRRNRVDKLVQPPSRTVWPWRIFVLSPDLRPRNVLIAAWAASGLVHQL